MPQMFIHYHYVDIQWVLFTVAMVTWLPSNGCYGAPENFQNIGIFNHQKIPAPERFWYVLYLSEKKEDGALRICLPNVVPLS